MTATFFAQLRPSFHPARVRIHTAFYSSTPATLMEVLVKIALLKKWRPKLKKLKLKINMTKAKPIALI